MIDLKVYGFCKDDMGSCLLTKSDKSLTIFFVYYIVEQSIRKDVTQSYRACEMAASCTLEALLFFIWHCFFYVCNLGALGWNTNEERTYDTWAKFGNFLTI